ncbi:hypothetical protein [Fusobacterium animalis]|uniref:hypothetical protein n=1 Tax=Fusobacterium animalis TaxID=76859 RepID=UPI0030D4D4A0
MRDVLENKNFDVFYSKVLEILKRKAKEKNNNDNLKLLFLIKVQTFKRKNEAN